MSIITQKSIRIADLPDSCMHKANLVSMVENPNAIHVNVVLLSNRYAYIGYPHVTNLRPELAGSTEAKYNCQMIHSFAQVAKAGNKLEAEVAKELFPGYL